MAKQSIFGRISTLIKANVNALIDSAEDPQKMLDQLVRDYTNSIADAESAIAETIGNLRLLEQGNWRDFTKQPRVCHMQALRQVLTPTGLYNCPAHRGVEKARLGTPTAYADEAEAAKTGRDLSRLLDTFDASQECAEVTCLYNGVNWWLEKMIEDPRGDIEPGEERVDYFL